MPSILSYDVVHNKRDVSAEFDRIQLPETPLLNMLGTTAPATNTKHFWWDDQRIPISTTLSSNYTQTTAGGVLVIASTKGLKVNSIISVEGQIKKVTAVTDTTHITTTHLGGSADADIASGKTIDFMANAEVESADYQDSDYTPKIERYNVTQILQDFVKISGTQLAVTNELNENVLADEVLNKMNRLRLGLGRAIWKNIRVAPSDNTTPRVMGGVDYFIKANGYCPAASTFGTNAGVDGDNFDAFLLQLEKNGGTIRGAWLNPPTIDCFVAPGVARLNKKYDDPNIGRNVKQYTSKYGHQISLVTDPNAPLKSIYVIDRERISVKPLQGRALSYGTLSASGDNQKGMLVGEYTLEIRNSSTMGVFSLS